MAYPNSYAYCHRCHKPVDPADYGYNPKDVHALIIFYCKTCQPQQDTDVIASVTVPVNSLHVGDIIPILPAEQHCRYPIPNAPGFYCPNKPQPNGYCQDHQAYRIGE